MRKRLFSSSSRAILTLSALCFLPALGCSTEGDVNLKQTSAAMSPDADGRPAAEVLPHWDALVARSGAELAVRWGAEGTPKSIFGALTAPAEIVTAEDARGFLAQNAPLFRLTADLDGLDDSATVESPMGSHYTFAQRYRGVPVYGAEVKVHVNQEGRVIAVNNSVVPDVRLASVIPALSAEQALAMARAEIAPADLEGDLDEAMAPELVIYAERRAPTLAWRVVVPTAGPELQFFVSATKGEILGEPTDLKRYYVSGTGQIFKVNAVVATQNNSLADQSDSAAAVPASAYSTVTLQGLAGTGYLDGQYASGADTRSRGFSATNSFLYDRSSPAFSETMAYYSIDYAERYIQSLGFNNVNNRQQVYAVDRYKQDNSYYTGTTKKITYGTGGVDDAEDAEVILHEYGHSIQDNQVPGFGSTAEGGAMGEGFGDYWGASVNAQFSGGYQDLCVAEWDATSYASGVPHCLRRLDSAKHYPTDVVNEVHADGEMWSSSLWQIRTALGAAKADKLVLEAHFLLSASANFSDGANALVTAAINLGYTATEVSTVRTTLKNRGFTVSA